jgi:serine/threonine-protein kinase ULK/ATG1
MDTHRLYIVGATTNPVTLSLELSIVASLTLSDSFRISDDTVAIKVIDMKNIRDVIAKEMLQCEIEALKTLSHPNVLKCHEVFKTVNNCYIVTEFCSEGDLASLIKTKKRLAEGDARSLISDIVAGFLEIADKNYLHRDLKLANIFVSNGIAKIADFGFAKRNTNPGER